MSNSSSQQDETSRVLQANAKYAADYANSGKANLPMPPGRKLIIVTCMDAVRRATHMAHTAASSSVRCSGPTQLIVGFCCLSLLRCAALCCDAARLSAWRRVV